MLVVCFQESFISFHLVLTSYANEEEEEEKPEQRPHNFKGTTRQLPLAQSVGASVPGESSVTKWTH